MGCVCARERKNCRAKMFSLGNVSGKYTQFVPGNFTLSTSLNVIKLFTQELLKILTLNSEWRQGKQEQKVEREWKRSVSSVSVLVLSLEFTNFQKGEEVPDSSLSVMEQKWTPFPPWGTKKEPPGHLHPPTPSLCDKNKTTKQNPNEKQSFSLLHHSTDLKNYSIKIPLHLTVNSNKALNFQLFNKVVYWLVTQYQ